MNHQKIYLLIVLFCFTAASADCQQGWTSAYLRMDKGKLLYLPDSLGNTIPDFSRVGYKEGRSALPAVTIVKTISPSAGSEQALQSAIDAVAALPLKKDGFRGAILLKKGLYKIAGTVKITASGIVLRGEGEETVLVATGKGQRSLVSVSGTGKRTEQKGSRQKITQKYVPLGAKFFTVSNAAAFKKGDSIIVFRPGTQQWISDLKMDQIDQRDSTIRQWSPKEYDLHFERVITGIEGNTIFIDNPVVMAMEEKYGGGEIYKYSFNGRISNIGIEHLRCESEYSADTDEDHGWDAIHLNRVQDAWVKNVTAVYFGYSCVNLGNESRNITVINCKSLDAKSKITGGRRYSFNNDGQLNLVMHCMATEGRHDYVTGAQVRGPNVFYNCRAEKTHADIGPHHRWATGTLYDNIISDGEINAQDRGNWGTGHGWSGVNQVFWNCTASRAAIQDPWVSGINYVFAMKAKPYAGRLEGRTATHWEEAGEGMPSSLYIVQLKQSYPLIKQ